MATHARGQIANGDEVADQRPSESSIATTSIEALRTTLGPRLIALILFGSRARGDHADHSDWDVLVIARGLPDNVFERHLALKRALPPTVRGAVSLLAKTPQEFEAHVPSLYLDIALDAQILYDPKGYAARRLERLRQVIARSGLERVRGLSGDAWRWRTPPTQPWHLDWNT